MHTTPLDVYVGSRQLLLRDDEQGISFPVLVQYPTFEPSQEVAFGLYVMDVSPDATIVEGRFPLVVISHGNGGSHLLYRTISTYLAEHGYIVAMLEHYGNNRNDNHLENTVENLVNRPRHVILTIDTLLAHPQFGNKSIDETKLAVIGHSMGGYTALAVAGGTPRTREGVKVDVPSDTRIKAIVLLAPGAGWFMNGLNEVNIPILMYTAEHDPITPDWNAEAVLASVPDPLQVTYKKVANAGHFSFLSPFPSQLNNPHFLPSTDPEGFDREAFHQQLQLEVLAFFDEKLKRNR